MNKCVEFVARKAKTTFLAFVALDGPSLWPLYASLTPLFSAFWPWCFQSAKWNLYLPMFPQTTSTKVLYNFHDTQINGSIFCTKNEKKDFKEKKTMKGLASVRFFMLRDPLTMSPINIK